MGCGMASPLLQPPILSYLTAVQRSTSIGVHRFFRRNKNTTRSARTVYRWQQELGDKLLVIPSVATERLGLSHLHVFVRAAGQEWLSVPYAVEASWLTNFHEQILYLHCIIPTEHERAIRAQISRLPCTSFELCTSGSGWQQFLLDQHDPLTLPIPERQEHSDVLQKTPFVVPALMESWRYPNSLPVMWQRISTTLGNSVRSFLPRTRLHPVNGKTHITATFRALEAQGLVRQQIIRYHPLLAASIEVFLTLKLGREELATFLDGVRSSLHAFECYPTTDGYFCRLLGPHRLLDVLTDPLPFPADMILFHTKRSPGVRFAYEQLFDPRSGAWRTA